MIIFCVTESHPYWGDLSTLPPIRQYSQASPDATSR